MTMNTEKRKWSCQRKVQGYLLQVDYGEYHLCTFVDCYEVSKALDVTSLMEYHIIRLNRELADAIFPLAKSLDHWSIQRRLT